jgi:hypothetical protein
VLSVEQRAAGDVVSLTGTVQAQTSRFRRRALHPGDQLVEQARDRSVQSRDVGGGVHGVDRRRLVERAPGEEGARAAVGELDRDAEPGGARRH